MDDASLRVSDSDRDEAVAVLREHLLAGRDTYRPDAPTVQVRVLGFVGTIDVWRVPYDMRASSYSDILHGLKGRRRELPG